VEAGIRVNDRLIALYGLLKTNPGQEKPEETTTVEVEQALARVRALEDRLRTPDQS
jgi:hypothetical protein